MHVYGHISSHIHASTCIYTSTDQDGTENEIDQFLRRKFENRIVSIDRVFKVCILYISVYIEMHVCMFACLYTFCVCICMYIFVFINVYMYVHVHLCMRVCVNRRMDK